jgi:hypothetical protein
MKIYPLTELTTATIKLLCREIGVVNTARFLNQFTTGYGNYTEEREQLLGDRSVDEIVAEIKRRRQASDVVQGKLDPA